MWWTGSKEGFYPNVEVEDHSYYAAGWGGHRVFVLPYRKLVIVHRVNTDKKGNLVSSAQIGRLLWHILDAAGETDIGEKPTLAGAKGIHLGGDSLQKTLKGCTIRADNFTNYSTLKNERSGAINPRSFAITTFFSIHKKAYKLATCYFSGRIN